MALLGVIATGQGLAEAEYGQREHDAHEHGADRRESFVNLLFEECRQAGSTLVFVSHDASLERLFGRTVNLAAINKAPHLVEAAS